MSEKTCLLLSILLISVVFFFTLPTAGTGRVLQADAPAQEDNYESTQSGNGRSKIGVRGSKSNPTKSAPGPSSPSQATPTGNGRSKIGVRGSKSNPTKSATGQSSPSQASPTRTSSRTTIRRMDPSPCSHIPGQSGSCDTSPGHLASTGEEPPSRLPQTP